jgi:hypothetical protein
MKKLALIGLAAFGLAAGAFAQGTVVIDNGNPGFPGLDLSTVGNFYSGAYGLQVYILNNGGATVPGNINNFNGNNSPLAFANMLAAGYTLEHTYVNQTITPANAGTISLGTLTLNDVSPAGANTTIALVAWQGSGATFNSAPNGGVITFANPTGNPNSAPPGTPANLTGWKALGTDLVMTPVPEPSILALAGLGAAALMGIRRRK